MKYVLMGLFILGPFTSWGVMDFGNWQEQTPYGDLMENNEGKRLWACGTTIQYLEKWYFYRGYTMGAYHRERWNHSTPPVYFIIRSQDKLFLEFSNETTWQAELSKQNLIPYWIRWHTNDWHSLPSILFFLFFGIIIWLPISLVLGFLLYVYRKDIPAFVYKGLLSMGVILVVYIVIHDTFPQSFF
ncbi:hypothetical protein BWI93_08340 [Siphonobacter sp. BAB-5385]|uniref:hypothetical protein n=1 Tax=Siphonobacter sp. BAB-5385 TaxID=1864822 RepID=UPI000B9EC86A|nr:hypothetical protein [Siphonobacter sp. BAB-5385]OZI08626.1 hypothetical protein BWI93_08340 [Siphonobacter sp. BAB-5385]